MAGTDIDTEAITEIQGISPATGSGIQVSIAGNRIVGVTPCEPSPDMPFLARGLVDLQVNGYRGVDFNGPPVTPGDALRLCQDLAALGVTRFLATVITGSASAMLAAMEAIARARAAHPLVAAMVAGIHAEGPSISALDGPRGAHPLEHVRPPDIAEFDRWQAATAGLVRLVTLAPEHPGARDYIRHVSASGVIISLGHSAADPDQIVAACDAGARMSTHLGNGVAGVLPRHPNLIWSQLAEDRLVAGLISDGHHLSPAPFRAMLRAKGAGRAVLVSDMVALAGMAPGHYRQPVGDVVELTADGRVLLSGTPFLAGAATPLSGAVPRAAAMAGITLAQALHLATDAPARMIGLGGLEPGAEADLILFDTPSDAPLHILATWVGGDLVHKRHYT